MRSACCHCDSKCVSKIFPSKPNACGSNCENCTCDVCDDNKTIRVVGGMKLNQSTNPLSYPGGGRDIHIPMDLRGATKSELLEELCKREGVKQYTIPSGDYCYFARKTSIKIDGVAHILVVKE